MNILEEERTPFTGSLGSQWLEVLLAVACRVGEVGVVEGGCLLFQVAAVEQIGLVFFLVTTGSRGSVQGTPLDRDEAQRVLVVSGRCC